MNVYFRRALCALVLLWDFCAFAARSADLYERILVPVLPQNGWRADLWIRNDGDAPVDIFPVAYSASSPSRGYALPLPEPGVPPGVTLEYSSLATRFPLPYYIPLSSTAAGAILYVEHGKRQNLRFQLKVGRNLDNPYSTALATDTQVPVVPESDLATRMSLVRIAVRAGRYYTLRVYSLDSISADVNVAFTPLPMAPFGDSILPMVRLRLQRPEAEAVCFSASCPWPNVSFAPAYGVFVFDSTTVPEWGYTITVTSTEGAKVWAFLSETDPATKGVVIYAPN